MTKEEYKEKICPSCINYNYKRKGENCGNFIEVERKIMCKNYRKWTKCITKHCNGCRRCK